MKKDLNLPLITEAILAEYKVRTSEIQSRSSSENTFIQYHISALTAIFGGIILLPEAGKWLIFLVPIESSLFGLWWLGNSLAIADNGKYIWLHIEPKLNKLLGTKDALFWETTIHTQSAPKNTTKNEVPLDYLVFNTFALPSVVSITLSTILLILSVLQKFPLPSVLTITEYASFYNGMYILIAFLCLSMNIFFFIQFWKKYNCRANL